MLYDQCFHVVSSRSLVLHKHCPFVRIMIHMATDVFKIVNDMSAEYIKDNYTDNYTKFLIISRERIKLVSYK